MRAQRCVGMLGGPVHLHVYHGVVGDVGRIGNHAEELANGRCFLSCERASGAGGDNGWIDQQNHHGAVEAVEPLVCLTADMGHYESCGHGERAPGHGPVFQGNAQFAETIEQQTAEEGIKQAAQTDINLVGREAEAADYCVFGASAHGKQTGGIDVHGQIECQECREENKDAKYNGAEPPHEQGIDYILLLSAKL